ncbi:hypothetical protein EIP86_001530 [Pleurotus ostreatoroseus]|nr:hypothetical protein EIP86_001530 [Pleurotus ostreatoroseus]
MKAARADLRALDIALMAHLSAASKKDGTLRRARTIEGGRRTDWATPDLETGRSSTSSGNHGHLKRSEAIDKMSLGAAREELVNLDAELKATATSRRDKLTTRGGEQDDAAASGSDVASGRITPEARGIHRSETTKAIKRLGTPVVYERLSELPPCSSEGILDPRPYTCGTDTLDVGLVPGAWSPGEERIRDELWGGRDARRQIRLGCWHQTYKSADEDESLLNGNARHSYTSEIDSILSPHAGELANLLSWVSKGSPKTLIPAALKSLPVVKHVIQN